MGSVEGERVWLEHLKHAGGHAGGSRAGHAGVAGQRTLDVAGQRTLGQQGTSHHEEPFLWSYRLHGIPVHQRSASRQLPECACNHNDALSVLTLSVLIWPFLDRCVHGTAQERLNDTVTETHFTTD